MSLDEDAKITYYDLSSDRPLSDVVLETIADVKGKEVTEETCILFSDIDPTGLDILFNESVSGNTVVTFECVDCKVTLLANEEIEIRATLIPHEEK